MARKDLGLATDLASEFGVPMPLAAVAEQNLIECLNRGWGAKDMTAAWALQEDRAGERASTLIGYVNIYPNPQFAARPADWIHDEGGLL